MIALPLIGFFVFTIYPILWTFKWSLFSYNQIPSATKFIGFDNFVKMFTTDFTYWKMWGNTLLFAFCKIPLEITIAMMLALALNNKLPLRGFFRSMYYLPCVVSVAVIGLVFSNLFSYYGVINSLLMKFGIISKEIEWFSNQSSAMTVLVLTSTWATFGTNVMYLLAALTNISEDVYEAAAIDGAGAFTKFFKVTLPMIAPVFKTILLLSIIGTLSANDLVLTLTGGAPGGKTFTVMSYLTKQFVPGFVESAEPALGYGCAMSVVTTILYSFIAYMYNMFSRKMDQIG